MISKILISRLVLSSSMGYKRSFQLCSKRMSKYYFSQSNKNDSQKSPQKYSQNQPSSQTQQKVKVRSSIQRLKQLKQQRRQQDYQKKLQQINITTGGFNSLTSYLWLQKQKWFYLFLAAFLTILFTYDNSPLCYKTMGVVKDPFTGKKKFMIVNQYRQRVLQKTLIQIIDKQLNFWTEESMKGDNSQVNKALQKKLQTALLSLNQKYGIEFKKFPKHQTNYQITQSGQTIVASVLGQDKLIISTKLLRLSQQSIQNLILLMHSLHSRYLHVQNVSFWERINLRPSYETRNIIKLEKTFISNSYAAHNIEETIQLVSKKYAQNQQSQKTIKQSIEKALKQLLSVKSSSKSLPQFDLRKRLKNANDFII